MDTECSTSMATTSNGTPSKINYKKGKSSDSNSTLSIKCPRWLANKLKRKRQPQNAMITQIWLQAAAVAAGHTMPPGNMPGDQTSDDEDASDIQKLTAYRAHAATMAPLMLGMSGLGGAMIRKSKRRLSDFTDIAHLAERKDGMQLTHKQITLVKSAWREANKKEKLNAGEWIFRQIAADCPEVPDLFLETESEAKNANVRSGLENEKFKAHAKLFHDALEMTIESLDCLDDSLGPLFVSYGSQHAHLECEGRFRSDHWDALCDALCDFATTHWKREAGVAANRANRQETIQAWRMLILFIVNKVKEGYSLEMETIKSRNAR